MRRAPTAIAAALWLIAGAGAQALAHQQTTTFGEISYPASGADGADLTWSLRVRTIDLARLLGDRLPRAQEILRGGLKVAATTTGGETHLCAAGAMKMAGDPTLPTLPTAPAPTAPEATSVFVERFTCGANARTLHLRYDLFFDHDPYHASYTRLLLGDAPAGDDPSGASIVFHNLAHEIAVDLRVPEPLWRTALLYLRLGVAHILTGYDHLSFLMALLLAAGLRTRTKGAMIAVAATPRQALRGTVAIVSAFTVAHSITLITQVLHPGWLSTRWVEPAIAFSVAYVGFENLVPRAPRGRWLLVFGFGLVHGLGFASVLREIGLPRKGLLLTLLSFNLGVELGQLLVVALALPIVVTCAGRAPRRFERWGLQIGSALIGAFGTLWLVLRLATG
jgi:HupE / UreJ protein